MATDIHRPRPARKAGRDRGGRGGAFCLVVLGCGLVLAGLGGCETAPRGDSADADVLYHHNWWNYQRRGTDRLAGGNIQGAREDFERALGLRPGARFGYDRDHWRVRTYGMHYLEDYFPNREYGVTLFLLGAYEEAAQYLARSISQTPSGRARSYLNQARRELLRSADPAPPLVRLDSASRVKWTPERIRRVEGRATGVGRIERLTVQGHPLFIELAEEEFAFSEPIPLKPGTNSIEVSAVDLLGRPATAEVEWFADWQPPQLVVRKAVREQRRWLVEGVCRDDHGLRSVLPGQGQPELAGRGSRAIPFRCEVTPDAPVLVTAEDLAGNRFQRLLRVEDFRAHATASARRFAQVAPPGVSDTGAGRTVESDASRRADRMRPTLEVAVPADITTVHAQEFYLDGAAHDPGGLAGLSVNGESLLAEEDQGATEPVFFARRVPLDDGTNTIEVAAVDVAGNENVRTLRILRLEPDYLDADYRLTVGVPPLRAVAEAERLSEQVGWAIEEELHEEPVRFHLVERDEGWEYIMRELDLSASDLADPAAALRIRKLLPAELLFLGRVVPAPGGGATVYLKIVETGEKGRVLFEEDVYADDPDRELSYKLEGLVMKVEQRFPLVSGTVVDVRGGKIQLDVGGAHGVRSGMGFIVLEPMDDHQALAEARVRNAQDGWVSVVARRVRKTASEARAVPPGSEQQIRPGDLVHAR